MRIGIDIDGVLTNYEKFQLENLSKYYWNIHRKKVIVSNSYYSSKIYNVTRDEDDKVWNKAIWEYMEEPPRVYASEIIKKLKEDGNEIYIITARSSDVSYIDNMTQQKMQDIVIKWLEKYDICYDEIIFSSENKTDVIKDKKIDIMIEDKPKNIDEISMIIPVICFHSSYNECCKGNNIIRCYNWYDVYFSIKKKEVTK